MRGDSDIREYAQYEMARRALRSSEWRPSDDWADMADEFHLEEDRDSCHEWIVSPLTHGRASGAGVAQVRSSRAEQSALENRVQILENQIRELLEANPGTSLVAAIIDAVRRRAATTEGVTGAYVNAKSTEFILTGPTWTEALSEVGAALAIELQESLAPSGTPYIEGSFIDLEDQLGNDWVQVYP